MQVAYGVHIPSRAKGASPYVVDFRCHKPSQIIIKAPSKQNFPSAHESSGIIISRRDHIPGGRKSSGSRIIKFGATGGGQTILSTCDQNFAIRQQNTAMHIA